MKVADQILDYVRRLHPAQRQAVKAALRALETGAAADAMALQDDLEGFYRLRVGKFRVVYRYLRSGEISCEFIDVRATVYERFTPMPEIVVKPKRAPRG
jgi:mRNA interferase RelE/StbE